MSHHIVISTLLCHGKHPSSTPGASNCTWCLPWEMWRCLRVRPWRLLGFLQLEEKESWNACISKITGIKGTFWISRFSQFRAESKDQVDPTLPFSVKRCADRKSLYGSSGTLGNPVKQRSKRRLSTKKKMLLSKCASRDCVILRLSANLNWLLFTQTLREPFAMKGPTSVHPSAAQRLNWRQKKKANLKPHLSEV